MAIFPRLTTNAVAQYPLTTHDVYSTRISRFADGAEQRFREFGAPAREWLIRLDKLSATEVEAIDRFYRDHQGRYATFTFIDPWDESEHSGCRFASGELSISYDEECRARIGLIIRRYA
jgi:hypothetical protein